VPFHPLLQGVWTQANPKDPQCAPSWVRRKRQSSLHVSTQHQQPPATTASVTPAPIHDPCWVVSLRAACSVREKHGSCDTNRPTDRQEITQCLSASCPVVCLLQQLLQHAASELRAGHSNATAAHAKTAVCAQHNTHTQDCNQQLQDTALSTSQKAWSTCNSCSKCVSAMCQVKRNRSWRV